MADTLSERLKAITRRISDHLFSDEVSTLRDASAELDRRDELALRYEAWVRAMHGPTSVPPVVDRSIEEAEQALLKLIPEAD